MKAQELQQIENRRLATELLAWKKRALAAEQQLATIRENIFQRKHWLEGHVMALKETVKNIVNDVEV